MSNTDGSCLKSLRLMIFIIALKCAAAFLHNFNPFTLKTSSHKNLGIIKVTHRGTIELFLLARLNNLPIVVFFFYLNVVTFTLEP